MYRVKLNLPGQKCFERLLQRGMRTASGKISPYREKIIRDLQDGIVNLETLHQTGREKDLRKFQRALKAFARDPAVAAQILGNPEIAKRIPKCIAYVQAFECNFEKEVTAKVLKGDSRVIDSRLKGHYGVREGKMAGLLPGSKVLVLGSGSLPLTAIAFNRFFGAKCTCVDNDLQAVGLSEKILSKLGLAEEIKAIQGDATQCPVENYDLILVATHCYPKEPVFKHILEKGDKDVLVVYRSPVGLHKLFYHETLESDTKGFQTIMVNDSDPNRSNKSVLLLKK